MLKKIFSKNKEEVASKIEVVKSPIKGKVLNLDEVPDDVFATKMLGDGVAIEPEEGYVYSPIDGEVIQLFLPSKHAICIKGNSGVEVLIHIGLDTVSMKGEGFEAFVNTGDRVMCGQELIKFDLDKVKSNAKSIITPVIITNIQDMKEFNILQKGNINARNNLLEVIK